jgi:hypothetical protein
MSPQLLGAKANQQQALYDGTKADIWAAGDAGTIGPLVGGGVAGPS